MFEKVIWSLYDACEHFMGFTRYDMRIFRDPCRLKEAMQISSVLSMVLSVQHVGCQPVPTFTDEKLFKVGGEISRKVTYSSQIIVNVGLDE